MFIIDFNHGMSSWPMNYLFNELEVSDIEIGDGVWVGNNVIILSGVHIEEKTIIGADSVVTKDIPLYCLAVGNPARIIKKFDSHDNVWKSAKVIK
ncbi:MAG TPA: hypothetical protein DEB74_11850 [Lachnospiraceae bacterium]|nr:hypothetical protein [Lachnospiraceae bacterium]